MNSTDPSSSLPPPASQSVAWAILGPEFVGWTLSLFLTGVAIGPSIQLLSKSSALNKREKWWLAAAIAMLVVAGGTIASDILLWATYQRRDEASLDSFMIPDAYFPLPCGLTAAVVQMWFAHRAWEICNRSFLYLAYISLCITGGVIASFGLAIENLLDMQGTYIPSILDFSELYLWAAVVVDCSNSFVIMYGLWSKRTGFGMPADNILKKIIFATMESAMMTTSFAVIAAITCVAVVTSEADLVFLYCLPPVYVLSLLWCLSSTNEIRKQRQINFHCSKCNSADLALGRSLGRVVGSTQLSSDWLSKTVNSQTMALDALEVVEEPVQLRKTSSAYNLV